MSLRQNLRVPLAWKMLVHKKKRLALSIAGVMFAVLIMFMQLGFFNGFNDSQALLTTKFEGELVMMDVRRAHLSRWTPMQRTRLAQAAAFPEVAEAIPILNGTFNVRNTETGQYRRTYGLAFPPYSVPFDIEGLSELAPLLTRTNTILFDAKAREIYGPMQAGDRLDVNGEYFELGGQFGLGANFTNDGTLIMSEATFVSMTGGNTDTIAWGLLRLREGVDVLAFRDRLQEALPIGLSILTPEEMREREIAYTIRKAPVGIIFGVGLVIGFIIGTIICYQILFNEITDHLTQFATLKAMGFSASYLRGVVLQEAALLGVVGFFPGLGGGYFLYWLLEDMTGIVMFQTPERAFFIFVLTVVMCVLAGIIAVKRVVKADPADVF
jgi:putative ABC transport system permease protein